jgi:hypothetical protein
MVREPFPPVFKIDLVIDLGPAGDPEVEKFGQVSISKLAKDKGQGSALRQLQFDPPVAAQDFLAVAAF